MNAEEIAVRVAAIRDDKSKGASELARDAVQLLRELSADRSIPDAVFGDLFLDTGRSLAGARPSMASLLNAVGSVTTAWSEAGGACAGQPARDAVAEAAQRWLSGQDASLSFLADHAAEVIGGSVITLSYSSNVLRALEECWHRELLKRVLVAESRPLCEGRRTAAALVDRGIPTTLIADAEIGVFVEEADVAVVGADTIRFDGSLVNKSGTVLLALAARSRRIPFYTVAESHKVAPSQLPFVLEEKAPEELLPEPIPGVAVRNVYFDLTPARYITGYITERGLLDRRDVLSLAKRAPGLIMATRP
jgi:ribose 1,5-bisphosphate isomerase